MEKSLTNYIIKSNIMESQKMMTDYQKQELIDLINSGELTAKDAMDMINTARYQNHMGFNTGRKERYEAGTYTTTNKKAGYVKGDIKYKIRDRVDDDKYGVKAKLEGLDIPEPIQKSIISQLISSNMMDRYIKYINKDAAQITVRDIINGDNVFKILGKTNISPKILKDISQMTAQSNNVSQGKYEILLKMFLSDYDSDNHKNTSDGHKGDIVAGDIAIEIKTDNGRIDGQGQRPLKDMVVLLKKYAPNISNQPFDKDSDIEKTVSELLANNSNKELCNIIAESIGTLYPESKITSEIYSDFLYEHVDEFINNPKILRRCIGVRQIIEYQYSENWNYMMVINTNSGKYILISENEANMNNAKNNLRSLYNNNKFTFGSKGLNTGDSFSKAMQIKYNG